MKKEIETLHKQLIRSDEFDSALKSGSDVKSEIAGTMKQRVKNNYDRFYDMMLLGHTDIQEICNKRKKDRTQEEVERLKKFVKDMKAAYRLYKEFTFVNEDEKVNDDGTSNSIPKKLTTLVDKLALVVPLLEYVGKDALQNELHKRGITIACTPLEDRYEAFQNEQLAADIKDALEESCGLQKEIEVAERSIAEEIYPNMVPTELQYDKNSNPAGIKESDFKKMVELKFKLLKSEKEDEQSKDKSKEKVLEEAEKRTYDITRNETVRYGLMSMGLDGEDSDN